MREPLAIRDGMTDISRRDRAPAWSGTSRRSRRSRSSRRAATTVFVTGGTGYIGRPLVETLWRASTPCTRSCAPGRRHGCRRRQRRRRRRARCRDVRLCRSRRRDARPSRRHAESESGQGRGVRARRPGVDPRHGARRAERRRRAHRLRERRAPGAAHARVHRRAREGEAAVAATGIPTTFLRPWYVLGPGHYWPYALVPLYALGAAAPADARAGHSSRPGDARRRW